MPELLFFESAGREEEVSETRSVDDGGGGLAKRSVKYLVGSAWRRNELKQLRAIRNGALRHRQNHRLFRIRLIQRAVID